MSIGYACILLGVPECSLKSLTLKNANSDNLNKVILHNLTVLDKVIDYNINNNIKLFRISSDIIPFGSHLVNEVKWWIDYEDILTEIGSKIKSNGIRVSMHPGQYTVLNSPSEKVAQQAVNELIYHTRFLDALGMDSSHKIILHVGGVYGNKVQAIKRFIKNYRRLPQNAKDRLVIENDEKCYSIDEVLEIGDTLEVPVVFDNLHHMINPAVAQLSPVEWIMLCNKTWHLGKDGRQKIHYSQQAKGGKPGAHSHTIGIMEFLEFYKHLSKIEPDIMLEVKDKNLSALKCIHSTMENTPVKLLEKEWAKYKYLVLSHSQTVYLQIRGMLKEKESLAPRDFYQKIEEGLHNPPTSGSELNAVLHVWGYFKDITDIKEKHKFNKLLDKFEAGLCEINTLKNFLFKLTLKYDENYLKYSYYFVKP